MFRVDILFVLVIVVTQDLPRIICGVGELKQLKFVTSLPTKMVFVKALLHHKCEGSDETKNEHDDIPCRVNQESNITWQICSAFNKDIHADENHYTCHQLLQRERKYCRSTLTRTGHDFSTSIVKITGRTKWEPHKGCIRCIAEVGNQTISAFADYDYKDQCGTPTRFEAINPRKWCHRKNAFFCQSKEKECLVDDPDHVDVIGNFTENGEADLVLRWKQERNKNRIVGVYGYHIIFSGGPQSSNALHECRLIYTKYNNTTWLRNGTYYYSVAHNIRYRFRRDKEWFRFSIQSLPSSKNVRRLEKEMNFIELCDTYTKLYNVTPKRCLAVSDLRLTCDSQQLTRTVTWNVTGLPPTLSEIYISYQHKNQKLSPNATSFTFQNASRRSRASMCLKVGGKFTYWREINMSCDAHTNALPNPAAVWYGLSAINYSEIGLYTFGSLCLLIIFVVILIYRVDKCSLRPLRIHYYNQFSTTSSVLSDKQDSIKVMIVYPEGCGEIEDLVAYLGNLLRQLGVEVLVDIFEEQRVAEEGKTNKLVNDFKDADYVVVLCTGINQTKNSKNFDFVMKLLLLPACNDENSKRFIAVALTKCRTASSVPLYLQERSYVLSRDLEFFLQHVLHGIQTNSSSNIFRKACQSQIENISDVKNEFRNMDKQIEAVVHPHCHPSYCCKGKPDSSSLNSSEESLSQGSISDSCVAIEFCPHDKKEDIDDENTLHETLLS